MPHPGLLPCLCPPLGLPWVWGGSKEAPEVVSGSQHAVRFAGTAESLWPRAGPDAPTPEECLLKSGGTVAGTGRGRHTREFCPFGVYLRVRQVRYALCREAGGAGD